MNKLIIIITCVVLFTPSKKVTESIDNVILLEDEGCL